VKDRAFVLAGIAHNIATFQAVLVGSGSPDSSQANYADKTTRGRKDTEHLISNRISGKKSGLSEDMQGDLKQWDQLFNYEVHGGMLSFTQEVSALYTSGKMPSVGPTFNDESLGMYLNRSAEIGWLIVRLLPFLQLSNADFGPDWEKRRSLLDESFRYMVEELDILGKRIGLAFITMVDANFSFKQPFHYFEADCSA